MSILALSSFIHNIKNYHKTARMVTLSFIHLNTTKGEVAALQSCFYGGLDQTPRASLKFFFIYGPPDAAPKIRVIHSDWSVSLPERIVNVLSATLLRLLHDL